MLFDTGSCDFWVPSSSCKSDECEARRKYKKSLSHKPFIVADLSIPYGNGKVEGELVNDVVIIGDLHVSQVIGIANYINLPFLNNVDYDGIIGKVYNKKMERKKIEAQLKINLIVFFLLYSFFFNF